MVQDKEVTLNWLISIPLKKKWESQGCELELLHLRELEEKILEGWEVMFDVDKKNKTKYRFVVRNNPDHVLMRKK